MLHTERELKIALKVKKILDEGIRAELWGGNLFLKGVQKRLEGLREQFERKLSLEQFHQKKLSSFSIDENKKIEVYIALYQSQGNNFYKWQEVVTSLVNYTIGRPIYRTEKEVQEAICFNNRKLNSAYAVVQVSVDAILLDPPGKARYDHEGRCLLRLSDSAVRLENIKRFIHASGNYKLVRSFLVKQN